MNPGQDICCLREDQKYRIDSLVDYLFPINGEQVAAFVEYMRRQEVCKTHAEKKEISFPYVGMVEFRCTKGSSDSVRKLVFFEPKFFPERKKEECALGKFTDSQKIVLKAILKYQKTQRVSLFSNGRISAYEGCSTLLSSRLALVLDVMEKGIYQVPKIELTLNGQGNIDWTETFARLEPFFLDDGPCYINRVTREMGYEDDSYISRLQMCLASQCLAYFEDIGLAEPLGLFLDSSYNGDLEDFGTLDYCKSRLMNELRTQFIDDKQQSLRLMLAVLEEKPYGLDELEFQAFGMSGFHALWERAIKDVFVDDLERTPCQLGLLRQDEYKANLQLKDFIAPPIWISTDTKVEASQSEDEGAKAARLRPDFVAIGRKVDEHGNTTPSSLIILDAKYYQPEFVGKVIRGAPGVGDIDKQLLYEIGYLDLVESKKLKVFNAFFFPGYKEPDSDKRPILSGSPFASISVDVFELLSKISHKRVRGSFDSYIIDGLALLDSYIHNSRDDEQRSCLMKILSSNGQRYGGIMG